MTVWSSAVANKVKGVIVNSTVVYVVVVVINQLIE